MSSMDEVILAINFIEANLTKKMDLDMISGAVHYSKYHLHRVFSDTVGLTIHDYIQRRQLTEAAKLLVFSGKPHCADCIFIRLPEPAGIYQCFYSHV